MSEGKILVVDVGTSSVRSGVVTADGEVVAVHIDKAYITEGVYETANAHPILRAGRLGDYFEVSPDAMFTMDRANWPIG